MGHSVRIERSSRNGPQFGYQDSVGRRRVGAGHAVSDHEDRYKRELAVCSPNSALLSPLNQVAQSSLHVTARQMHPATMTRQYPLKWVLHESLNGLTQSLGIPHQLSR